MKAMKKSLMMRGMVLMHYGITVLLFVSCWWLFYRHIAAGAVFGAVNISVYAFYAVSLLMLSRIYSAYREGLLHVGDLFYGQVLSNLISLGLTYLLACALARRLINPLAGFGCAAVQALFSAGWTISANRLYFSLHKPKRTVVISRDESDLRKLEEIRFFAERWSVERTVQWDEENVHDLPYKKETPGGRSFEAIQKLMRIMEDYEAVFVSGVSATPAFDLRLQVKAGLTGYAQIYGRYNTEPQDKLKMDLMYINHASLAEDIKLIFATVRVLFLRDSTSGVREGQTTASVAEKTEKSA